MEPTLMVVGLNYRTAPVAVRERFWISENRRYEALVELSRAEGIDEVIVLATCNRTEFLLWVNDVTLGRELRDAIAWQRVRTHAVRVETFLPPAG